jgi:hypothetical protein
MRQRFRLMVRLKNHPHPTDLTCPWKNRQARAARPRGSRRQDRTRSIRQSAIRAYPANPLGRKAPKVRNHEYQNFRATEIAETTEKEIGVFGDFCGRLKFLFLPSFVSL